MSTQICLGFHSYGTCTTQFAIALAGVTRYEGSRLTSMIHIPSPYVTEARNKIVMQFLTKTKASHLMMIDVDEEFPEDAVSETLLAMQLNNAQIMFGCYALGDFRPSIFHEPTEANAHLPTVYPDLEPGKDYRIYAGSTGWLLVTREALMAIWAANSDKHWPWFEHVVEHSDDLKVDLGRASDKTLRLGEDFSFSKRARECGIPLWGTTRPLIIHDKHQPLLPHFMEGVAMKKGLKVNNAAGDNMRVAKHGKLEKVEINLGETGGKVETGISTEVSKQEQSSNSGEGSTVLQNTTSEGVTREEERKENEQAERVVSKEPWDS